MKKIISLDIAARPYATATQMRAQDGNPCRTAGCQRRAGDGYVCAQCVEQWEVHLGNVAAMIEDLDLAETKRTRFGGRTGNATVQPKSAADIDWTEVRALKARKSSKTELPEVANRRAGNLRRELHNELVGQVRAICETYDLEIPALGGDTVAISRWLLDGRSRYLSLMDDGNGLVEDLDRVMARCMRAIDSPIRYGYVRQCSCGLAVWARAFDSIVTCACGKAYVVANEQAARIDKARGHRMTINEAAGLSGISKNTIRSWIRRGDLTTQGKALIETRQSGPVSIWREVDTVRFGDVLDLGEALTEKGAS